jgi:NAD(P)-dependent dehydrogenase (short-subunit alcohol dehydrogenase family)
MPRTSRLRNASPKHCDSLGELNAFRILDACPGVKATIDLLHPTRIRAQSHVRGSNFQPKAAIDSATRVLASELGPRKIRVNAINPGHVNAQGTKSAPFMNEQYLQMWRSMAALGRLGDPDDIAKVIVFLASPASGWLTGETIYATGGVR